MEAQRRQRVGRVSDSTGAVIVAASVAAENLGTAQVQKTVTNKEGSHLIPSLQPGAYKITVESSGFKTFMQSGITLQVNENVRADAVLQIGSITESVSVSARRPSCRHCTDARVSDGLAEIFTSTPGGEIRRSISVLDGRVRRQTGQSRGLVSVAFA
jgi:hypothetical protein